MIYLLALLLSVVGSYQVYHGQFSTIYKEIAVIFNSVIKLFAFFPTLGFEVEAPLAYELAIWIAPLGTIMGFFSLFKTLYLKINRMLKGINRPVRLILGWNEAAQLFIRSSLQSDYRTIVLLDQKVGHNIDEQIGLDLGIHFVSYDFNQTDHPANQWKWREFGFKRVKQVVSFVEEPESYSQVVTLADRFEAKQQRVSIYIQSHSDRMKDFMQDFLSSYTFISIYYFDLEELVVNQWLSQDYMLSWAVPDLSKRLSMIELTSFSALQEAIPQLHLAIVSGSSHLLPLLRAVANQLVIKPMSKIKITILGPEASKLVEEMKTFVEGLDQVYEIDFLVCPLDSFQLREAMLELVNLQVPASALIVNLTDERQSLLVLDRLYADFSDFPIAVRIEDQSNYRLFLEALNSRFKHLQVYGNQGQVLNEQAIIDQAHYQKAIRFNASYQKTMSHLMDWPISQKTPLDQWLSLTSFKKESSYYQAMHQTTKSQILKYLGFDKDQLLDLWRQQLVGLSVSEQVDRIEADPLMNFMAALEHHRWDNFHFMRHFVYGSQKDLAKRQHDCLIVDWYDFMTSPNRDKAIYDFLSTLDLLND